MSEYGYAVYCSAGPGKTQIINSRGEIISTLILQDGHYGMLPAFSENPNVSIRGNGWDLVVNSLKK